MQAFRNTGAACAVALVLTACAPDDDPEAGDVAGQVETGPVEATPGDDAPEEVEGPDDDTPDEGEPDAESDLEAGADQDVEPSSDGTPEDVELELSQRHPGGTVLQVSGLRFEGNTILVDAEFINGAASDVRISVNGGDRLRLQDSAGNTYNFVTPDDVGNRLELFEGESIGGEFAFLGPVDPQVDELVMIANLRDPVSLPLRSESLREGTRSPEFALEGFELTW